MILRCIKLFLFIVMMFSCVIVNAEKREYENKKYDWSKVKTISLVMRMNPVIEENEINIIEIEDTYEDKIAKKLVPILKDKQIKLLRVSDVKADIKKQYNKDLDLLWKTNPDKANELFDNYLDSHVDLKAFIEIGCYDIESRYVEARSYTYTTNQTSSVMTNNGGFATITTPVTHTNTIPGHYSNFSVVDVRLSIVDPKASARPVWLKLDSRSRTTAESEPKDILGRILNDYFNGIGKRINK